MLLAFCVEVEQLHQLFRMVNFAAISEDAIAADAAARIADTKSLMKEASYLLRSSEQRELMGKCAEAFSLRLIQQRRLVSSSSG